MRSQRPVWGPRGRAHRGRGPGACGSAPVSSDSVSSCMASWAWAASAGGCIEVPWSFSPAAWSPRPSPIQPTPLSEGGSQLAVSSQASRKQEGLQGFSQAALGLRGNRFEEAGRGLRRGAWELHLSFPTCEGRGCVGVLCPSNQRAGEVLLRQGP